jgi:hypothetical protein
MADDIAERLVDQALALQREVSLLSGLFEQTGFLGDVGNLPHAHYGYLMATLGQIDTLSVCNGAGPRPGQTSRMVAFLETYVRPGTVDMHRLVVQMLRHALMHTGALRYLYDSGSMTAYTWRLHFGDLPVGVAHYTVTQLDPTYQGDVLETAQLQGLVPTSIGALNISLTALTEDLVRGAKKFVEVMLADQAKCALVEAVYPKIQMQVHLI